MLPPALRVAVLLAPFALAACGGGGAARRPNVVLIVVDTLRADKLGCYGYPGASSPEIDRLAEEGVRFARVVSQSSWTRPSIGSLLTSRYPRELGIYREKNHVLDDRFHTLAELLQRAGYTTLGATANPNINSTFNFAQGFDDYLDSNVLWRWMEADEDHVSYQERPIQTANELFGELLKRVERTSGPWYLQVTIMEMHEYADRRLIEGRGDEAGLPLSAMEPLYVDALRRVSVVIGAFVETLAALPGWEDTLFCVTSDHGEGLTDHPDVADSRSHGYLLYESQVSVPLILYATGDLLPRGRVVDAPVRLLDLMPTILELAGVPGPEPRGVSLAGVLRGQAAPELPEAFVVETSFRGRNKIAAVSEDWKYIENRDGHQGVRPRELQANAGGENGVRTDASATNPAVVEELAAFLRAWEARFEKQPAATRRAEPSQEELDQLEALGYTGDE